MTKTPRSRSWASTRTWRRPRPTAIARVDEGPTPAGQSSANSRLVTPPASGRERLAKVERATGRGPGRGKKGTGSAVGFGASLIA